MTIYVYMYDFPEDSCPKPAQPSNGFKDSS